MNDDFPTARQKHMRAVFERLSREGHTSHGGNPDLAKFEERVQRLRSKMSDHFTRHKPAWWSRETTALIQRHKGHLRPSLSPKMVMTARTSPAALAKRAHENVELRCRQRLDRFEQICARMRTRLNNSPDDPEGTPRQKPRMKL